VERELVARLARIPPNPELVNVRDVLRLLTYGKSLDLFEGPNRYNLLTGEDD
jgi:hypothetical protein